jgi:uncharacterized RDD family membrane protein YckC
MSSYEPPAGPPAEQPPTGDGSTPPPPPAPPPPAPGAYNPGQAAPPPGVPRPGELLDRFLARLIDGVILGVAYGILYAIFSSIFLRGFTYSTGEWLLFWIFVSIISTALYLGYFGYLESSRGQTVGKQVLKLKVVGPDGVSNPTMEQAVRRNIWLGFGLLNIIPFVGAILGGLAELAAIIMIAVGINGDTVRRQAWHDKFAGGTQVLKIG